MMSALTKLFFLLRFIIVCFLSVMIGWFWRYGRRQFLMKSD
jgi:hypothetical protein